MVSRGEAQQTEKMRKIYGLRSRRKREEKMRKIVQWRQRENEKKRTKIV